MLVGWRELKGSGSHKYLQYMTGVFPGCWGSIDSSCKAGWTIHFPAGRNPKDAQRALLQKRIPDNLTWRDYSLTMLFASGDKAALTELHQSMMDTLPLSDTVHAKLDAKRKRKPANKFLDSKRHSDCASSSAIDTDYGQWKEERRKFKAKDMEKRRLERETVEIDRAQKLEDSGDASDESDR